MLKHFYSPPCGTPLYSTHIFIPKPLYTWAVHLRRIYLIPIFIYQVGHVPRAAVSPFFAGRRCCPNCHSDHVVLIFVSRPSILRTLSSVLGSAPLCVFIYNPLIQFLGCLFPIYLILYSNIRSLGIRFPFLINSHGSPVLLMFLPIERFCANVGHLL
jgi:hypothetical protein